MTDVPLDQREREELCDLLLELGPDAPTLCEGWTTADLAAHLVVRERDPRSMPGILKPDSRFGRTTANLIVKKKAAGYETVVARIRRGAPLIPWRIKGLRTLFNLNEYVVHHEDVRRANGLGPRTDRPDLDAAVWGLLQKGAKMTTRSVKGVGLVLRRPSGEEITVRKGEPVATITGEPVDVLLYLLGRRGAAQDESTGDPVAVTTLQAAKLGI